MSLFLSLFFWAFSFNWDVLNGSDDIRVIIVKEEIKLRKDTVCKAYYIKIKENKMYKDNKALTDSIRVNVREVFFY